MTPLVAGWLAIGIPLLVFGFFFLGRNRPVMLMYFAACMIGLGYLTATGAVEDVGAKLLGNSQSSSSAAPRPNVPARNPADGY
ncbi:MAG: hypothetical protein JNM89_10985 [Hyphomicrobiaceae bacterium]|nr:hypothetical protein [Hyphomicrobiaceae bacterium]